MGKVQTVDIPHDSEEHHHPASENGMDSGGEIHCAEDIACGEEYANGDEDMICMENEVVDGDQCEMEEEKMPLETRGKLRGKEKYAEDKSAVKCDSFDGPGKSEDKLDVAPAVNFADYAGKRLCLEDFLPAHGTTSIVHMSKYWSQRYRLFSKYDEGICMDKGEQTLTTCTSL